MITLYSQEEIKEVLLNEAKKEAMAEGRAKGRAEGINNLLNQLRSMGVSEETLKQAEFAIRDNAA